VTSGTSKELGLHADSIQKTCSKYASSRDKAKRSLSFRSSYGSRRSLGWVPFSRNAVQIKGNKVIYLGFGLRFFGEKCRPLPEIVKTGCFVEDARGHWYVCFNVEAHSLETGEHQVGIDLGLKTLATCSSGEKVPALQHYRKYQNILAIAQRAGNRRRTKVIHAKISNARHDQLHKASSKIARENQLIVVGNVNAASLKKTRMAKSVSDAGWTTFRDQLCYKASRHNAVFIEANERLTSQVCSDCGSISGPKGIAQLGIRRWDCCECGISHDRDINAARNILRVGQSALPHADESRAYRISASRDAPYD